MTRRWVLMTVVPALLAACSKTEPHVGETYKVTQAPGVSVVERDSRTILKSGGLAGEESTAVSVEADVYDADPASRLITLKTSDGEIGTYRVSDQVRNLSQVRRGDRVSIEYLQSVSFEVRQPTLREEELSGSTIRGLARSPLGELPGAFALSGGIAVVTIESIDRGRELVTVRTKDGKTSTIKAKYPENLGYVRTGQKAVVTAAESVIASVERVR